MHSALRIFLAASLGTAVCAQAVPEQSSLHLLDIDSGYVANTNFSPASLGVPEVVWSTVVTVPQSSWLRLRYAATLLSGSHEPGADGSFLRITSLHDGYFQTQHLVHVGQWQESSAYFNGDAVLLELLAYPGTGDNRIVLGEVSAGPALPAQPDSICGPVDDRVLSSDPRVGRNQPTGCTSWLIDDCNHCFLTAGHCAGSGLQVVQFNVPLSTGSGAVQQPPPQDQYAVDTSSLQTNGGQGVGNDWAYFGVFPNSTTGLVPFQANGGLAFQLQSSPPPVSGQNIRITGNGSVSSPVSPTWNLVQKTHAGPYSSFTGTTVRYTADTTGGNSGSPVIVDGTDQAIGIHTHGGCTSTSGSNAGTGSNHPALTAALANPLGVCECPAVEFVFPNGLPAVVQPNGTTTVRLQLTGPVGFVPGSVRLQVANGGSFQAIVPTAIGPTTFDATLPTAACGSTASYYFSVLGTDGVTYTSPQEAPTALHTAPVAVAITVVRNHNFNTTPPGWNVSNTSLTTGAWVRGTPVDSRGPDSDFDGSGQCWVTGNTNNEDVDGGPTVLVTETVDLSARQDPRVSFAIWFDSFNGNPDVMTISASNNGGATWTVVENTGPTNGWQTRTIDVLALFGTPGQFALRFSVADQPNDSVTEAALDAFRIDDYLCTQPTWSAFGTGCSNGASAPNLQLVNLPAIGGTLALTVSGLTTPSVVMILGLAAENSPLALPQFAPNCTLLARPDLVQPLGVLSSTAVWLLPIPANPSLAGTLLYQQALEAGPLWTLSQGGVAEIR